MKKTDNLKHFISIDPSIKETGFILWKKYNNLSLKQKINQPNQWKPLLNTTFNFESFSYEELTRKICHFYGDNPNNFDDVDIYIERGFHSQNRNTTELLDCLRGNIFGFFQKLYHPPTHGVAVKEWHNWCRKKYNIAENWNKNVSIQLANSLAEKNDWFIEIKNNHNLAEALLIGWFAANNRIGDKNNE